MIIKNIYYVSKYLSLLIVFTLVCPSIAMEKKEKGALKSSKLSLRKKRRSASEIGPQVALKGSKAKKNESKESLYKSDNEEQRNSRINSFKKLKQLIVKNHGYCMSHIEYCTNKVNKQKKDIELLQERVQKLEQDQAFLYGLIIDLSSKNNDSRTVDILSAIVELENFDESEADVQCKSLKAQLAAAAMILAEHKKSEDQNYKYAYVKRELPDEIIDLNKRRGSANLYIQ